MSDGMKRRDFLKVLGATGAGAATAGCSTGDVARLIPYVVPADEVVPGMPTYYTSTCRECPAGCGIHVETHEGRATKVEGNPDNPISHGNLCSRGQASVQGLYHPDRYQGPLTREIGVRDTTVSWTVAEEQLAERIKALQAAGRADRIVFLTESYQGTMGRLVDEWVAGVGARRVVYDNWNDHDRGANFADADYLVSFGADFLETWGSPVDYAWQFAQLREVRNGTRGKFVWVGPHRPLTGLNADQWVAPKPGTEHILAGALAGEVDVPTAARLTEVPGSVITTMAREFRAGKGVALGPGTAIAGKNQAQLAAAIRRLNGGRASGAGNADIRPVLQLVEQMRRGEVELLLIATPDPGYTLPGSVGFREALEKVPYRVSFSTFPTATSLECHLVLPDHHFLEAWDDYVPKPGVRELVQPAMRPVFNTKQTGDVLLSVASLLGRPMGATTYYDYLHTAWTGVPGGWREAVKRGGSWSVATATPAATAAAAAAPAAGAATPLVFEGGQGAEYNLVVYPSYRFFDGRTANRPWLLELPDPVTKVSWQSTVELHPKTAEKLGVEQGDFVTVTSPYGQVTAAAYVWPGVREDSVAIQTGLGHPAFGRYTEGRGVNPNVLLSGGFDPATGRAAPYGVKVSVVKESGKPLNLPFSPGDGVLFEAGTRTQKDRELALGISAAGFAHAKATEEPEIPGETIEALRGFGGFTPVTVQTKPQDYPPPESQYGQYIEGSTRWAMAVDLNRCIGCAACVTACYAENNIPVVGEKEVARGRALEWMRIERYYGTGSDRAEAMVDNATDDTRFLPMFCQQCGNAPCEPVCPVYAAYHTADGLNGQVYNRCVGTRYCANNCPYKVRYFNWWTYEFAEPLNWQLNPDVTVREKGVMEKCTFCVQRIREAERTAQSENRPIKDGEVVPACVQTCPTEVFVFGNIQDPNSKVAQAARSVRSYRVLEELNTQPAIVYLKRVTLGEPEHSTYHETPTSAEHGEPVAP
ncbi:MAG TPA: molybdopterin dinucleotide binding domain-containing protein [Longimicrobiaceae bacterium]|nr:molybdopterin dinucleotide binding domain-containing protein [Longimicrobiaceae bacterium]